MVAATSTSGVFVMDDHVTILIKRPQSIALATLAAGIAYVGVLITWERDSWELLGWMAPEPVAVVVGASIVVMWA